MGGKVWSDREERYFWRTAITYSAKRVGADRARQEKSWVELALNMQIALKEHARRKYTGTMLFEHYFQNIESQRVSPNAGRFVREYLRKLGHHHGHPFLRTSGPKVAASLSNGDHNSQKDKENNPSPVQATSSDSQSGNLPKLTSPSAASTTRSVPQASPGRHSAATSGQPSGRKMLKIDYLESHHDETSSNSFVSNTPR